MRRVVRRDCSDPTIVQGCAQCIAIGACLDGRIALYTSAQALIIFVAEKQVREAGLRSNPPAGWGKELQFCGRRQMRYVQPRPIFVGELHS